MIIMLALVASFQLSLSAQKVQPIDVYITDPDSYTNVRNAPKGDVVGSLDNRKSSWCMTVTEIKNGWCHIQNGSIIDAQDDTTPVKLKQSKTGYWISCNMVGFSYVNDQPLLLRESPSSKAKVVCRYNGLGHPIEIRNGWVKVRTDDKKHTGWMPVDKICANPLTTCC